MLEDPRLVAAAIWASGAATSLLFWHQGGRYVGIALVCWFVWFFFSVIIILKHQNRRPLLWTSVPIIIYASYGPVFVTLLAVPYLIDRIMGKSTL